jgi:chromosome segregation ATPase
MEQMINLTEYGKAKIPGLMLMSLLLVPLGVQAEATARSGGNQAGNEKALYLLRQATAENQALEAENRSLQDEIAKRDAKIESLKSKIKSKSKSLQNKQAVVNRYQKSLNAQRDRMGDVREKFKKLVDKYRELVAALKLVETERAELQGTLAEKDKAITSCAANNKELNRVANDLLQEYRDKGVWDALVQSEPITQLGRVEIENEVEEKKYRIDSLKVADGDEFNVLDLN